MTSGDVLHALGVVCLGAIGWFGLQFVGRPIREFFDMRREIKRLMLLHWNDSSCEDGYEDPAEIVEALRPVRKEFAELAARVGSFDKAESPAAWLLRLWFSPQKAAQILQDLSIRFGAQGEERERHFRNLDTALHFRSDPKRKSYHP